MKTLYGTLLIFASAATFGACNRPYSCPNGNHCYGIVQFASPGVQGMISMVDVGRLSNTGDGFVDNEMWIVDRGDTACASQNNTCWVEAGYVADNGTISGNGGASGTDPHFFWADNRPNGSFIFHDLGSIPSNYFGQKVAFLILQQDASTWEVDIQPFYIQGAPTLFGTSTNNAMKPQSAEMGQELAGTKGASADAVTYTVTGTKPAGSTSILLTTVTTDGAVTNANPPNSAWLTRPSALGANGGTFQTHCCN